jgi:hypothetical protein
MWSYPDRSNVGSAVLTLTTWFCRTHQMSCSPDPGKGPKLSWRFDIQDLTDEILKAAKRRIDVCVRDARIISLSNAW